MSLAPALLVVGTAMAQPPQSFQALLVSADAVDSACDFKADAGKARDRYTPTRMTGSSVVQPNGLVARDI